MQYSFPYSIHLLCLIKNSMLNHNKYALSQMPMHHTQNNYLLFFESKKYPITAYLLQTNRTSPRDTSIEQMNNQIIHTGLLLVVIHLKSLSFFCSYRTSLFQYKEILHKYLHKTKNRPKELPPLGEIFNSYYIPIKSKSSNDTVNVVSAFGFAYLTNTAFLDWL